MKLNWTTFNLRSARVLGVGALSILLLGGVIFAVAAQSPQGSKSLAITTKSLPNAVVGVEYYAVIAATGGEAPYDCSGKGLPPGIAFHYASDTLGGKPATPGKYVVVITVKDSADPAHTVSAKFELTVSAGK